MSIKGIVLAVVSVLAGATLIAFGGCRFFKNHYKKGAKDSKVIRIKRGGEYMITIDLNKSIGVLPDIII